jgi:hypothetical protein
VAEKQQATNRMQQGKMSFSFSLILAHVTQNKEHGNAPLERLLPEPAQHLQRSFPTTG